MELIKFENQLQLDEYISTNSIKYLGSGREGFCFLLPDDIVIKKLSGKYYPDYITKFENIDISSFCFAESGILIDKYLRAFFMKYAGSDPISKINFDRIKFSILKDALNVLVTDIKLLSEKGISCYDVFSDNIIFDGTLFKLIDVQDYKYSEKDNLENDNIINIIRVIYLRIFFAPKNIRNYFLCKSAYAGYLFDDYLLSHPDEFIDGIREEISTKYDIKINTIGDMKRALGRK